MSATHTVPRISNLYVPILLIVPTLAAGYGVWQLFTGTVSLADIILCLVLGALTEYGVTFGYHRLTVHRSFVAHPALRAVVLALGSMAYQGPVINWAATHTKHHAMSDQEGDPHTPTIRGFLFAHLEWLLEMTAPQMGGIREKYGQRYLKDPMLVWFDKTFLMWCAISLLIPFAIGGWSGLIWGGFIRIFMTSHVTWCVNSVCHVFGSRMFETKDHSRNNFLIGLLALGEGWHNNHHAFPASAFHGLKWWQVDITAYSIRIYEKLGLVKKVVRIPQSVLAKGK